MLFVLTGEVQVGKTRWLEGLVDELAARGIISYGVIAPGIWLDRRSRAVPSPYVDANGFEKTGIRNVLLPSGESVPFARRIDLAERDGTFDPSAQSAKAQMKWQIDETAIKRVNDHLAAFGEWALSAGGSKVEKLLVVDELGRLELEFGGGLVEAMRMLERGPIAGLENALVVVRKGLLSNLDGRFASWGGHRVIHPDSESMRIVVEAFGCR